MKQLVTDAIILNRIDYGEADRILTLLTPQYGKLSLLAKGVRRIKSKLAGGIELFSISTITFVQGRGSVGTLISTRLVKHYSRIVTDLDRTMLGYELIKQFNKITEDEPGPDYFDVLHQTFEALDDDTISLSIVQLWFSAQLMRLGGHTPNLRTDVEGHTLTADQRYDFDFERMSFRPNPDQGRFGAAHIKFLRLTFAGHPASLLAQVRGTEELMQECSPLMQTAANKHI